jgi:hypothetical protein
MPSAHPPDRTSHHSTSHPSVHAQIPKVERSPNQAKSSSISNKRPYKYVLLVYFPRSFARVLAKRLCSGPSVNLASRARARSCRATSRLTIAARVSSSGTTFWRNFAAQKLVFTVAICDLRSCDFADVAPRIRIQRKTVQRARPEIWKRRKIEFVWQPNYVPHAGTKQETTLRPTK